MIDYDRVIQVSHKAQIYEVIQELPSKFDAKIGERGIRLSGGQRQRIGIARALYKDASVIVFDEATSSLDEATEASVMDAIYSLEGITVILVAHRISTLSRCDTVYEFTKNGITTRAM